MDPAVTSYERKNGLYVNQSIFVRDDLVNGITTLPATTLAIS